MAKNVLDMILWHPKMEIKNCNITYIHRGNIGNLKTISGNQVNKLERGFLILNEGTEVPCHRIVKIECNNKVLWNK